MNLSSYMEHPFLIIGFVVVVIIMLALDLGVFNKKPHAVSNKEALTWSIVWIGIAMIFGGVIYQVLGKEQATEYYTAYIIEKALSVDNLFVFILVFSFFKVPSEYHHKVLFWGIIGAVFFRAIFIFSGVWLIEMTYIPEFEFLGSVLHVNVILTLFGFFLVYAGVKSALPEDDDEGDFSKNIGVRVVKSLFPLHDKYEGDKFFFIQAGKKLATPLLLVVAVIEATDVLFAVDSIPAIFAVSKDPFILYSSNIFAILGLRSLYFLLANFMKYFVYLKYGLALILSFIGAKMVLSSFYHISSSFSLIFVGVVLVLAVIISLIFGENEEGEQPSNADSHLKDEVLDGSKHEKHELK